jgi:polar amino acid transport system substrate-binding protein
LREVTAVVPKFKGIWLASLLLVSHVNAQTPKTLKACTVAWPPFVISEGGKIDGSDTKILQAAALKLGYDLKIDDIPWKRCLKMAEEGTVDIVYPASKNPEREVYLDYPKTPLHPVSYVFVIKTGSKQEWTTKKDVSSLPQPIGIPLGYSIAEQLRKETGVKLDENAKDDKVNLQKLIAKPARVETIIIEKMNGLDLIQEMKVADKLTMLDVPYFKDKEYYITVSKKSPYAAELTKALDTVLPGMVPKSTG